ncbi:Type IV secretory pathway%2C VirD4 components [Anaerostipes hadrus]|uniref:Type IV secretory pathway, VirD4 components n=1 Tax=Anaerostipes hadrus TaxID=649756 RepID=A0A174JQR3_ANAHA|nr:type IV secretory system conjugative DNA transfer family protein [Anaerostipes hadrus]CUO99379.1 Type IV secretory pathway%2C VirD4 components [Anaerostipes hadrus]
MTKYNQKTYRNICIVDNGLTNNVLKFIMKNMNQTDQSFIVLDEDREILNEAKERLKNEKYEIKTVDFYHPDQSDHWNPIISFQDNLGLERLTAYIMDDQDDAKQDPFFHESEKTLLMFLLCYLEEKYPKSEQNFLMLMKLLSQFVTDSSILRKIYEDFTNGESSLHCAEILNAFYTMVSKKTEKTVMTSLIIRLTPLVQKNIVSLMEYDTLQLDKINERKTAVFIELPGNDALYDSYIRILLLQVLGCVAPCLRTDKRKKSKIPVQMIFSAPIMKEHGKILTREIFSYFNVMNCYEVYSICYTNRLNDVKEFFEMSDQIIFEWYFSTYIFHGCESLKRDIRENHDLYKKIFCRYGNKREIGKEELLKLENLSDGRYAILINDHELIIDDFFQEN